ncbi:MAG: hydantoinase/oxoprolinase family protein [Candidatus Acidiferrales bacterium]
MRIAIDTGGTFTDCVFVRDGRLEIVKVFSTPRNPARAIANALERILAACPAPVAPAILWPENSRIQTKSPHSPRASLHKRSGTSGADSLDLVCGTTVGTNALLERRGGRVALVTTAGFEDVIEIGRQARLKLYDFFVQRPPPLVPPARRIGMRERIADGGRVLLRPTTAELRRVTHAVQRTGAESVAVCLLFSFANSAHERAIARELRAKGLAVSVSHEILPEFREFERTATTVINAYLLPVMSRYLREIERYATTAVATPRRNKGRAQVRIMQSSGGIVSAKVAAREPVRTILSGPAGGVLGAQYVAECSGFHRVIGFDMGGTSTDVALIEGGVRTTNEATVADLPVAVPILDIHTVGAGGGSIARFDRAGALRVGPESAGADPGPICYGRGDRPTVTDAHVVLGHIAPEQFLGGEFQLDERRAREWMERARGPMRTVDAFAQGIIDVANATMEKAIRVISVERGHDPRDYALAAFGGAGGLHACDLATALGMTTVLVPRFPGALSALGILRADVVKNFSQTVQLPVNLRSGGFIPPDSPKAGRAERTSRNLIEHVRKTLAPALAALEKRGLREMALEGFPPRAVRIDRLLDMRYVGQAFELTVPAGGDFVFAFHRAHEQRYGYADAKRAVEIVNVRARMSGATAKPSLPRSRPGSSDARMAIIDSRRAFFSGKPIVAPVYDRARLRCGHRFAGPAIVMEYSATTLLPAGWSVQVDSYESLIVKRQKRREGVKA